MLNEGWNLDRTEPLRVNTEEQREDLRGYFEDEVAKVRQKKTLIARSTGRNRAGLKRAILTAVFNLTVPRVTANLLSRERYPKYNPQRKRIVSQDSLLGHFKTLVFLDENVFREALFAFGDKEEKFWFRMRCWFREMLGKWDPKGLIFKHCQVGLYFYFILYSCKV